MGQSAGKETWEYAVVGHKGAKAQRRKGIKVQRSKNDK
jgi:hypothetical protein